MSIEELNQAAYAVHTTQKKKGAGKGYKATHTIVWADNMSRREYLQKYKETDPHGCGLFLCRIEYADLTEDRWWDVPSYRQTHLRAYRSKITAIRREYGLSSKDVAEYMRAA